jgi:hypothetical protein
MSLPFLIEQIKVKKRVKGIEPSLSEWESEVLPLNYTRVHLNIAHLYTGNKAIGGC